MSLLESLEKLVDIWESKGVPMRQHLRPGLTRAEIQAALSPLGLTPPEELYELYEWHDGVADWEEPVDYLFGEHQFLPLKNAIELYPDIVKYYLLDDIKDEMSIDLKQCFPFAFFMGDYCTIYCDPTPVFGLEYPVIGIYYGIFVRFENIDKMAQTEVEWLVSGIYEGDEPVDEELKRAIRNRLNSRIPDPQPDL